MNDVRAKTLHACTKGASLPTAEQMAAIRQYTLRDFAPNELMVRTFALAHNGIDRDKECFGAAALNGLRDTMVGKGSYIKHPNGWDGDSGPAEGRVFGAHIEDMSFDDARKLLRQPDLTFPPDVQQAQILFTDTFFARTPDNASLLTKLDAGIAGDISVGFNTLGQSPQRLHDVDGRELNAYQWQQPVEGLEQSLVWLGAQPGARAVKQASHHANRNPEQETAMTPEEIKALQTKNAELESAKAAGDKAVTLLASLTKALGEHAALLDAPEQLASAIADGHAFHKSLVDDIVTLERHLKITGDSEDDVKAARELYDAMPIVKLQAVRKALEARQSPAARIAGGDPNKTAPGGFRKSADGKEPENPLENPALAG